MKRYLHLIYESLGPLLGVAIVLTIIVGLASCSSDGWSLPWSRTPATGGVAVAADPFGNLWWIAPAGILCGLAMIGLLGMRREGIITALASIALAVLLHWLRENMTTILLLAGAGVVAYLLGSGQERLSALRGAWKLRAEGKTDEATALLRQALPWVDKSYRSQAKRRAKSGTIKPILEDKP